VAKFSVIIPLYNKERDIVKTLNSVLLQTFSDFEIVLVNDGSTDASEIAVKKIDDARISYFSKTNEGVAKTRNFGVDNAKAPFIAFLDADDYWHPHHLDNLNSLIEKFPDNLWYATAYERKINPKLIVPMISPIMQKSKGWQGVIDNYFEYSLVNALAWTSAVCFKTSFFKELGGFDARITHGAGEDTDLWIRAALRAQLVCTNVISARHNLDGSNRISHTPTLTRNYMDTNVYEDAAKKNMFLKKYLDLNRYSFAIQHRLANDMASFKKFSEKIDQTNLTVTQRFLIKQPRYMLQLLLKGKLFAEKLGIRMTSFK
jgi:glycosyltransferase involved in cell wall biosynthesis